MNVVWVLIAHIFDTALIAIDPDYRHFLKTGEIR